MGRVTAPREIIPEQIIEEYLAHEGHFAQHTKNFGRAKTSGFQSTVGILITAISSHRFPSEDYWSLESRSCELQELTSEVQSSFSKTTPVAWYEAENRLGQLSTICTKRNLPTFTVLDRNEESVNLWANGIMVNERSRDRR